MRPTFPRCAISLPPSRRREEFYVLREKPYSREKVRVLAHLDRGEPRPQASRLPSQGRRSSGRARAHVRQGADVLVELRSLRGDVGRSRHPEDVSRSPQVGHGADSWRCARVSPVAETSDNADEVCFAYGPPGPAKNRACSIQTVRFGISSGVIPDLSGTVAASGVRSFAFGRSTPRAFPGWSRRRAYRAVRGRRRQVHLHRPQLLRPCGRVGHGGACRADPLHEGDVGDLRAERRHPDSSRFAEDRLGSRAWRRHRQDRHATCPRQTRCRTSRATAS